jgi:hypothetical protein
MNDNHTVLVQVEVPKNKAIQFTKEYLEEIIQTGTAQKDILTRQNRSRVKKARSGKYMTRPPYGYLMDANNHLIVDYKSWAAQHVLAVFLTTAKTRLDPPPQGTVPFKIIHKKFLYFNGLDEEKADSPYIRAMITRRAYIGEIIYQNKHQGYCEQIVPRVIFDLVQEARYIRSVARSRSKNWERDLERTAGAIYENSLSDAEKWFGLARKPTNPQEILDFFRIRLYPIYTYRKKQGKKQGGKWKTKMGPLHVISKYSLKTQ